MDKLLDYWERLALFFAQIKSIISRYCRNRMIVVGFFGGFLMGTDGHDVLIDGGSKYEYLFASRGNDVTIYIPAMNRYHYDYYDGGKGIDTLWIRIPKQAKVDPVLRADLIRFHYFILKNSRINSPSTKGPLFSFKSFRLQVRNFEHIIVQRVPSKQFSIKAQKPRVLFHIKDTRMDSLV